MRKAIFMSSVFSAAFGGTLLGVPHEALAQNAVATAAGDELASTTEGSDEIVVTANKREQRQTDVGITIATASAEQLESSGVSDLTRLNVLVPGFSAASSPFGTNIYALRGITFNSGQLSAPPAVTTYADQAPLPYSAMTDGLLLDAERVEVLKGPQGTLFGQNATGGSINVIAAKPTNYLTAGFQLDVNHFGQTTVRGYISGPLSNNLRARLAGSTTQFGAWQRGYFLNNQKNGDENKGAGRLLLDWTPTDRLAVSVNLNANYDHGEQQQSQASLFPTAGNPVLVNYEFPTSTRDADFVLGFDTHKRNRTYQGVLRMDYEIADNIDLTSLSNYVNTRIFLPGSNNTAIPQQDIFTHGDLETFSQEVRLSGTVPSADLTYVLGATYQRDNIDNDGTKVDYVGLPALPVGTQVDWRYGTRNDIYAAFGNVELEILPRLTLTAGLRYTKVKQVFTGCTFDGGSGILTGIANFISDSVRGAYGLPGTTGLFVPGGCITLNDVGPSPDFLPIFSNQRQNQDNLSWRAGVNFKPTEDSLIYGLVSRGYKQGTFPVIFSFLQSGVQPVSQEQLTSYEVGAKASLLDRKLQANVSAFYYDYKDRQFFTYFPSIVTVGTVTNVSKSRVYGAEMDVTIRPVTGLTFRGALTYINTKILDFGRQAFNFAGVPVTVEGSEFDYAPPVSATADAEYRYPLGSQLEGYIGGNLTYNARTFGDVGQPQDFRIDAYTLVDVRLGVDSNKGWRAGVWVRNLTDKYYWTSAVSGSNVVGRYAGRPRTFGATFGVEF